MFENRGKADDSLSYAAGLSLSLQVLVPGRTPPEGLTVFGVIVVRAHVNSVRGLIRYRAVFQDQALANIWSGGLVMESFFLAVLLAYVVCVEGREERVGFPVWGVRSESRGSVNGTASAARLGVGRGLR